MGSDTKIKVLFFDEAVAFGGSVVVLAYLFDNIDRTRFTPLLVSSLDEPALDQLFAREDVLCWFRPKLDYSDRVRWMDLAPTGPKLLRRLWAYIFTIAALVVNFPQYLRLFYRIARWRPHVLHVNNGREGLLTAKLFGTPAVWHLHGISADFLARTYGVRDTVAVFVSISKYITAEAVKEGVSPQRILDIPNPAPVAPASTVTNEQWRARFNLPVGAVVIAHVGRLIRWKGQIEFLKGFAKMARACPDAYALVVGEDVEGFSAAYPKSLREFVAGEGLEGRVVFTGHIPNILELMQFADIVVHSSVVPEPFGLVITEAMSAGAAVIAARLGAPIEIVEHGITGLLVDPNDSDEFAAALELLASSDATRKQMAQAGQRAAREKYAPETFARRMESVYDAVLNNRPAVEALRAMSDSTNSGS